MAQSAHLGGRIVPAMSQLGHLRPSYFAPKPTIVRFAPKATDYGISPN